MPEWAKWRNQYAGRPDLEFIAICLPVKDQNIEQIKHVIKKYIDADINPMIAEPETKSFLENRLRILTVPQTLIVKNYVAIYLGNSIDGKKFLENMNP